MECRPFGAAIKVAWLRTSQLVSDMVSIRTPTFSRRRTTAMKLRRATIGASILLLALTSCIIVMRNASRAEPEEKNRDASAVTAFGAKGDGVTDDTDAIRRTVEQSRSGVIEFP